MGRPIPKTWRSVIHGDQGCRPLVLEVCAHRLAQLARPLIRAIELAELALDETLREIVVAEYRDQETESAKRTACWLVATATSLASRA